MNGKKWILAIQSYAKQEKQHLTDINDKISKIKLPISLFSSNLYEMLKQIEESYKIVLSDVVNRLPARQKEAFAKELLKDYTIK